MPEPTTAAAGPTVPQLKQMQCELFRLCTEREASLTASAGKHALAYVVNPSDIDAQKNALEAKNRLDGLLAAKDRYTGEVRYFDGDGEALLSRCLTMLNGLADYDHQEARRAAMTVIHHPVEHPDYLKTSVQVFRHLHRQFGILEFADMFKATFSELLDRPRHSLLVSVPAA